MFASLAPAFQSRNFRLFWLGQLVSTIGTSLQVIAEGWLIYDITESTFWLGAVPFFALLPVLPVSIVGSVWIDRIPRRKLIMGTQLVLLLQAIVFAGLILSGNLQLWHLIALYFVFGACLAIDHPARRAFLVDIVTEDQLANAVALNATLFNVAQLIGFAAGGILLAMVGAGGTIGINALTYFFPIIALALIRVPDVRQDATEQKLGVAVSEGFLTLWRQPSILAAIALMAVVGGLAWPAIGLMPAFAEEVIKTDEIGLGLLLAAGALGSIVGSMGIGRISPQNRTRTLLITAILLPITVLLFAQSKTLTVALILIAIVNMLILVVQSLTITLVQLNIADRVRGRVMGIYSILHAGADTGGNLMIGALAVPLGLSLALMVGGGVGLLFALTVGVAFKRLQRL